LITLGWLLGIVDGDLLELGKSDGDPLGFKLWDGVLLGDELELGTTLRLGANCEGW